MSDAIFIDSNVFMYAAGADHVYKQPSVRVLAAIGAKTLIAAISAEILQEILYRYSSIGLSAKGIALARSMLEYPVNVLSVTAQDLRSTIDLLEQHSQLKPRDAVHIATMRNNKLGRILSADRHFDGIAGIERIDIADFAS